MTEKPSGSPPKKKKRLTKKQAKLAKAAIKNPEATLDELGDLSEYSGGKTSVARALALPHVQDRMAALMDLHPETTLPGLHDKLLKGMKAKETKFFAFEGEVQETHEVDDNGTQFRYFEKALDMRGLTEKRIKLSLDNPPPMSLADARRLVAVSPHVIEGETA